MSSASTVSKTCSRLTRSVEPSGCHHAVPVCEVLNGERGLELPFQVADEFAGAGRVLGLRRQPPPPTAARRNTARATTSLCRSPWRYPRPSPQCLGGPFVRPVRVTTGARIRNLELIAHRRSDELERVAAHVDVGDGLLDLRHVAGDAFAAGAAALMMRVIFDAWRYADRWAISGRDSRGRSSPPAFAAAHRSRAVHVMTDAQVTPRRIHDALDEIVALHAVLVRRAVGIVREVGLAERVRLRASRNPAARNPTWKPTGQSYAFPSIGLLSGCPCEWHWMQVSVEASASSRARIEDVRARRLRCVLAARTVAFLAADVPFATASLQRCRS